MWTAEKQGALNQRRVLLHSCNDYSILWTHEKIPILPRLVLSLSEICKTNKTWRVLYFQVFFCFCIPFLLGFLFVLFFCIMHLQQLFDLFTPIVCILHYYEAFNSYAIWLMHIRLFIPYICIPALSDLLRIMIIYMEIINMKPVL